MSSIQDFEKNLTPVSDEVFNAAVELVQNMPKDGDVVLSNEEKLSFYGLFKQATLGQCKSSRPGIWHVMERYKWDAWSALGGLEPSKAKSIYVHNLQNVMDRVLENRTVYELLSDPRWLHIRPIVEPKFKILGRTIDGHEGADKSNKPCSSSNEEGSVMENAYSEALVSNPGSNVVSDDEYVDARGESPVIVTRSELSHSSSSAAPEDPMSRSLTSDLLNSFQITTKLITQQIQALNSAFNEQNKVLQRLFDKLSHYRIISWPLFIFLLIWPILVQVFIRYMFGSK